MSKHPQARFVNHLPDLMTWEDYAQADRRKVIRINLSVSDEGLEVLGDSPYPQLLEELLAGLGPEWIEMMLCG